MKLPLTLFLCACSFLAFSQDIKVTKTYYDNLGFVVDEAEASYYIIDSALLDNHRVYAYYAKSNKLRYIEAIGRVEDPKARVQYYESGELMFNGNVYSTVPSTGSHDGDVSGW